MNVRRLVVAGAAALALAGCGGPTAVSDAIREAPSTKQLDPVLEQIATTTDCTALQDQFDLAFNGSEQAQAGTDQHDLFVDHMDAANDRLTELGC